MEADLLKLALNPGVLAAMASGLKGFGSGAGMGGLVGAGAGALYGAGKGYSQARDEGASVGQSVARGLGGAVGGVGKGALLGAGAGGIAGALRPGMAASLAGQHSRLRGASNFGQRQVHALTGVGDAQYARSIGAGAADAEKRLGLAREAWHGSIGTPAQASTRKELAAAKQHFATSSSNEARGMTSIPGYLKSFVKDPMGTLRSGAKEQWQGGSTLSRGLMYGLPAAAAAKDLYQGEDPSGEDQGRFERAGKTLGYGASVLAAPLPILGDAVVGAGASSLLGRLGRGLDRRGKPPAASSPDPVGGSTQPSEQVVSDRAAGLVPESLT